MNPGDVFRNGWRIGKEHEIIKLQGQPTVPMWEAWLIGTELTVATASGRGQVAYEWICRACRPLVTMDDLEQTGDFDSLDA